VIRDGRKLWRNMLMGPMYLSIQQKETGKQIKKLLMEKGYTVKDVQSVMGFENPQAIYKWISGRSLPSLDNFVILSRLLHTSIEDILVIDGDIVRLWGLLF
jgi:transcriptional regulator with XRE-family HTH domain